MMSDQPLRRWLLASAFAAALPVLPVGACAPSNQGDPSDERASIKGEPTMEQARADSIRGRTIRWTWSEGPVAGVSHEHTFNEDGTVEWRVLDGPQKGHSAIEDEYAAVRIAEGVHAVSYLADSGYTLTVVLNFESGRVVGFASGPDEWYSMEGSFQVVEPAG